MTPKLIAVAGPLRGMIFDLTAPEVCLGREPTNPIAPADKSVSRRHCLIRRAGDQFVAIDLDSHNGTFVNDLPIKEQSLRHGDRLRLGASYFLVLLRDEEPAPVPKIEFESDDFPTTSLTKFRIEDALYSTTRDLNALMKISSLLSSKASVQLLQKALIDSLFEVTPAERGVIALTLGGSDVVTSYAADRSGPLSTVSLSRTITSRVLQEGLVVLSNDVLASVELDQVESLIGSQVRSLLCVPLVRGDLVTGFIYLDSCTAPALFDDAHVRVVTMIAGMAAGALERATETERLAFENERLRGEQRAAHSMIGESAAMRQIYEFIDRVGPRDSTVLILGESGTGKELAARALHDNSTRAGGPFVAVNCASLSENLLESDLFGHERGAFTGAVALKKGKLEIAEGGTIFLDEVGEIPAAVQARLLRVLQDFRFERLGSTRSLKADVRVIAATNRDLAKAVATGTFRQDLYYRLNVLQLTMPPLRDRREDILLMASYFIAKYAAKCNRRVAGLSTAARRLLTSYDWPGNVRELENAIERAIVLGSSDAVELEDLPEAIVQGSANNSDFSEQSYPALVRQAKREILTQAIARADKNYSAAARSLGVHPNNLHRLMRSVGLTAGEP
jgi:transcriptional regulator with GAF, ATPase, and Fis domain